MAQTVIVKLIDDIDGGDADETVRFSLDAKSYEIDLSAKNAAALRKVLLAYIDKGRPAGRQSHQAYRRQANGPGNPTLFSQLDSEEKDRFRKWAKMPTARRIGNARVEAWIEAGRP